MTPDLRYGDPVDKTKVLEYMSLDDLLLLQPEQHSIQLSERFNADADFRRELRTAIHSSLEGSWRILEATSDDDGTEPPVLRMKHTTKVMREAFADEVDGDETKIPTGDDLFRAIGNLCGEKASTHFIDIFGVQDRSINHSWHLDAGCSPGGCRTVLWGFPPESDYSGCGVFSHVVPLSNECLAPPDHNRMEPLLFDGTITEEHIVRPVYEKGKELLLYRDVDVLHSAPDVTYRTSIMRFM
ncbi:MAG: hypothetical protein SGARI_005494 [Bacillariaceae sp.]